MTDDVIEFVVPRQGVFGEGDGADFVGFDDGDDIGFDDEPPRSRWLTALAGLAVTALLAGGVIAAEPWSGDDVATAPTTTAAPLGATDPGATDPLVTGGIGSTTAADDPLLPAWLEQTTGWLPADGDERFVLSNASSVDGPVAIGDAYAIWTTEGATRTSGRWLTIDEVGAASGELHRDATVVDVVRPDGTWPAVIGVADDGVVEMAVSRPDGAPMFTLTGFGWSTDELLRVAGGVQVRLGEITYDASLTAGDGPFAGMVEVFHGTTEWYPGSPAAGSPRALTWIGDTSTDTAATVVVAAIATPALFIDRLVIRQPVALTSLRRSERGRLAELAAAGRSVELFRLATEPGAVGAAWLDGDGNEVTVVTTGDLHDLVALVASVERATDERWAAAVDAERTSVGSSEQPVVIGGSIGDGWLIQATSEAVWLSAADGWMADLREATDGLSAVRYVGVQGGYLVMTATTGTAASVVVLQSGTEQPATLVPLSDGTSAAGVRIDPRADISVRWLGADGSVLGEGF